MENRSSKNSKLRYVFYMLLVCVISYFGGYRHSNYSTVKYIETKYNNYEQGLKNSYERGTWATALHHKYYGNYGSRAYHDKVYESGLDPQNKEDIDRLLNAH